MAGPPPGAGSEPGPEPGQVVLKLRQQQRRVAVEAMRLRRRTLAVHGSSVVGPVIEQASLPRVVLQSDFVNIVEEPSGGLEIEVVRDADGRMRFYMPP